MGGKTYLVFDNRGEDIVNSDPNLITLANTYKFNVGKTDAEKYGDLEHGIRCH